MKLGISGNYRNSYDTPPIASTVPVPENPRAFKEMCPCPLPRNSGIFCGFPNFPQRHFVIPDTDILPKLFYGGPLPRSVPVIRGGEGDSPGIEGPSVNSNLNVSWKSFGKFIVICNTYKSKVECNKYILNRPLSLCWWKPPREVSTFY